MARVTVEDCLQKIPNRFALVVLASERARQLASGATSLVDCENKPAVSALREVAKGYVLFNESVDTTVFQFLEEVKRRGMKPPRT